MTPRSLLAITDFSQQGDRALARAAQLCGRTVLHSSFFALRIPENRRRRTRGAGSSTMRCSFASGMASTFAQ